MDTRDEVSPAELRSIPIAVLREYARAAVQRASVRAVAERIGIGRTTLNYFVSGDTRPHPRVRRLVALWYMAETCGMVVCESLLSAIPPDRRETAVAELMSFVRGLHCRYRRSAG